jgi:hypothetical protein
MDMSTDKAWILVAFQGHARTATKARRDVGDRQRDGGAIVCK